MLLTWAHQAMAFSEPSNLTAPVVSGGGLVGEELTCDPGNWAGTPQPTFTYQWKRNGVDIPGETNSTYTNVQADVAQTISCTVTAHNIRGSVSADSNGVQIGGAPVNTAQPVVSGDTLVGSTLATTNGTWVAFPAPTFTYQWLRQGLPISGANANTYLLVNDDEGSAIQCRVIATNFFGNNSAVSNAVGPIEQPLSAPVNTTPPTTNSETFVGLEIDCGNGIWTANPDPTFAYQWQADQTDIPSATADSYTLTSNELGKMMRVKVTATNSQGSADAFSAESGPVVNAP